MKALGFRVCGLGLGLSCVLRQDSACGMIPDSGLRTRECRLKGFGSNTVDGQNPALPIIRNIP